MDKRDIFLVLVAPVFEIGLIVLFVARKIYREYPIFFTYLIASVLMTAVRLTVIQHYRTYFMVYWSTEALYKILILLVLNEVFHWFFYEFYKYWRWFRLLFPAMVVIVLGASLWYALNYPPVQANRVISVVLVSGMAVNFIQAALFLLFFLLVAIFGLRAWRYSFAIVSGFGISALASLGAYWLRSEFGTRFNTLFSYALPVAYIVVVALWLVIFSRPEPEFQWTLPITPEQLLEEVKRFNEILDRWRGRKKMSMGVLPFLLGASASLTLAWTIRRRIRRIPDRTVYDTIPYLRLVEYEPLDALLDPVQEESLHLNLGDRKFRQAQKKRIKLLLNYLDSMQHNAEALREWGKRDRRRGVAAGEKQWEELGDNLVQHSINLRGGIFAMRFTLHRWLLQLALLPFFRAPHISTLRNFDTFDLFENYQQMVNAALDLGLAYGDEVHQKLVEAL